MQFVTIKPRHFSTHQIQERLNASLFATLDFGSMPESDCVVWEREGAILCHFDAYLDHAVFELARPLLGLERMKVRFTGGPRRGESYLVSFAL